MKCFFLWKAVVFWYLSICCTCMTFSSLCLLGLYTLCGLNCGDTLLSASHTYLKLQILLLRIFRQGNKSELLLLKLCIVSVPLLLRHFPARFSSTKNVSISRIPIYLPVDEMVYNLGGLFQFYFFSQKVSTHLKSRKTFSVTNTFHPLKTSNINSRKKFKRLNRLPMLSISCRKSQRQFIHDFVLGRKINTLATVNWAVLLSLTGMSILLQLLVF